MADALKRPHAECTAPRRRHPPPQTMPILNPALLLPVAPVPPHMLWADVDIGYECALPYLVALADAGTTPPVPWSPPALR